jgi:hypothetical protein
MWGRNRWSVPRLSIPLDFGGRKRFCRSEEGWIWGLVNQISMPRKIQRCFFWLVLAVWLIFPMDEIVWNPSIQIKARGAWGAYDAFQPFGIYLNSTFRAKHVDDLASRQVIQDTIDSLKWTADSKAPTGPLKGNG